MKAAPWNSGISEKPGEKSVYVSTCRCLDIVTQRNRGERKTDILCDLSAFR